MKYLYLFFSLFIISACVQDSPNIKQIENLQFFIDNKKDDSIIEIEKGLQYSVLAVSYTHLTLPTMS